LFPEFCLSPVYRRVPLPRGTGFTKTRGFTTRGVIWATHLSLRRSPPAPFFFFLLLFSAMNRLRAHSFFPAKERREWSISQRGRRRNRLSSYGTTFVQTHRASGSGSTSGQPLRAGGRFHSRVSRKVVVF